MNVLFYSNYCNHSKKLLQYLNKIPGNDNIKFVCIDKRVKKTDGVYIQFNNGQELLLPSIIEKVPALLLINKGSAGGNNVIYGETIYEYIVPNNNQQIERKVNSNNSTNNTNNSNNNMEPEAFNFGEMSGMSDTYSYWNIDNDSLMTKGQGGLQFMHGYVKTHGDTKIETPDENYKPDKIGNVSLDKLVQERNNDINKIK